MKGKKNISDIIFIICIFIDISLFLYNLIYITIGNFNFNSIITYLIIGGITYYLLKKHEKNNKEIKTESAFYIIKIMILFLPVGFCLMWKHGKNKKLNVVFSVLLAFPIITGLIIASIPEQSTKDYTPIISDKTNTKTTELQESNITTTKEVTTTNKTIQTTKKTTSTYKTTTAEPIELNFTQLYLDFFEPYINSIDELMPETFRQANIEKFADYDVQITEGNEEDMWKFEISDSNGNSVYMSFYPTNDIYENPPEDWIETLTLLTYNSNNKEISISDNCHLYSEPIYNTYDKNRSIPNQEVKNLDELKKFMFSVSMKLSETETTTTTTSQPITELPAETTETEPPPPLEPVQPEIAESNYVLNTSTMKVHKPNCRDVEKIAPENRWDYYGTIEDIQSMGYSACGHCHAW